MVGATYFSSHRWMQVTVLCIAAVYLFMLSDRGWIPHDEGLLSQSAQRVLEGDLPHIDFDDAYTGGQAMLHAMAFKILGTNLYSLRILLYFSTLVFLWATYLLTARVMPPWIAALVTLLAMSWSIPNYFAGLPSWYNLILAVLGIWTMVKYDESEKSYWLATAGALGGISFLFKLSGLFYVAAGILFLVYREQETAKRSDNTKRPTLFLAFTSVCLTVFALSLAMVIRKRLTVMDTLHFVVPGAAISMFLVANEWRLGGSRQIERFSRLFRSLALFITSASVPVIIFLIPYAINGGLNAFFQGVFVLPQKRIQWTDYPMPAVSSLVSCLPMLLLLLAPFVIKRKTESVLVAGVFAAAGVLLVATGRFAVTYENIWNTTRPLVPMLAVVGCVALAKKEGMNAAIGHRRMLFLCLAMSAMVSLVQFPYSFAVYFCYASPVIIVAYAALAKVQDCYPSRIHLCVLGLYLGFALVWLNHGHVRRIGITYAPRHDDVGIANPRFGLRTSQSQADLYGEVIAEVQRHSTIGSYIYATTDCPEIYFLSDRKNPTRTFYDFFEADYAAASQSRVDRILQMLETHAIDVVVFQWQGEFSGPPPFELCNAIAPRYPNAKHFVRDPDVNPNGEPTFSVVWREQTKRP